MSRTYLPYQDRLRVACYCVRTPQTAAGWTTVPGAPGMVCSHCGNPSPMVVLRHCMWCDEQFYLPRNCERWVPRVREVKGIGFVETEVSCFICQPED